MTKKRREQILQELKPIIRKAKTECRGHRLKYCKRVANMESEIAVLKSEVQEMNTKLYEAVHTELGVDLTDHFFGWDQDIIICFLYIPPSDSNWFKERQVL